MTLKTQWPLRISAASGLLVDAAVHVHLSADYDANTAALLSQGDLFRIQAGLALLSALLVLAVHRVMSDVLALLVAASAVVAVVLFSYVDLGSLAGLPDMYEPSWYGLKTVSAAAESLATVSLVILRVRGASFRVRT